MTNRLRIKKQIRNQAWKLSEKKKKKKRTSMMQGSRTFFLSFFDYYFSRETCPTGPISFESTSFTAKVDSGEREIKKKKKPRMFVCRPCHRFSGCLRGGFRFTLHNLTDRPSIYHINASNFADFPQRIEFIIITKQLLNIHFLGGFFLFFKKKWLGKIMVCPLFEKVSRQPGQSIKQVR